MRIFFIIFFILPLSLLAQFKVNDQVVYSRFFTMMTGIEEIELFEIIQINKNNSVRLKNPQGVVLTTHISSLQPIMDTSNVFEDRTILQLQKQFSMQKLKKINIRSIDLTGRFNDTLLFTGEKYLLAMDDVTDRKLEIEVADTFHFEDVGLSLLGVNEGNPDYFQYIIDHDTIKVKTFKNQPIYFELFLKLDGLKLYLDETIIFEFNQSD